MELTIQANKGWVAKIEFEDRDGASLLPVVAWGKVETELFPYVVFQGTAFAQLVTVDAWDGLGITWVELEYLPS